jgi:transcriptional/translational regulatory protein YebC/TACO1
MIPQNYTDLTPDNSEKLLRLIDLLEDIDDVTNIYTNGNFATENNE